jgi:myo-inositol-hexaphosphate 3-phosphohydrolase
MQNTNEGKLGDGLREIDLAYRARFPEKSTDLMNTRDIEVIKNLLLLTNDDSKYITSIISSMNKTASGEVPGWAYIAKVVKNEYEKKTKPAASKTEAELLAMCAFSTRQQMYDNITQAIIEDIIPAEELPINSWDDPNIKKILFALKEDGRISDEMLTDGLRGIDVLNGEDGLGKLIASGKGKEIISEYDKVVEAGRPF